MLRDKAGILRRRGRVPDARRSWSRLPPPSRRNTKCIGILASLVAETSIRNPKETKKKKKVIWPRTAQKGDLLWNLLMRCRHLWQVSQVRGGGQESFLLGQKRNFVGAFVRLTSCDGMAQRRSEIPE